MRNVPSPNGVKTGHTQQAGYVLVGSATRRGVTVVSAVLGDPSEAARDADSLALLRYGLEPLPPGTAIRDGPVVGSVALEGRSGARGRRRDADRPARRVAAASA